MTILLPDGLKKTKKSKETQKVQNLYDLLAFKGLIRAGAVIPADLIESALQVKYSGQNDWRIIGPYLGLKMRLESEGFFITQRDCEPPGFRILKTEEMAEHAMNKLMDNLASNYSVACVMAIHDITALSDEDKKKHKSVQQKAVQTSMIQHKMIMDQQFF